MRVRSPKSRPDERRRRKWVGSVALVGNSCRYGKGLRGAGISPAQPSRAASLEGA